MTQLLGMSPLNLVKPRNGSCGGREKGSSDKKARADSTSPRAQACGDWLQGEEIDARGVDRGLPSHPAGGELGTGGRCWSICRNMPNLVEADRTEHRGGA